ncbi:WD repeat-containing protein 36 [Nasonia vitripennis]|uniref:Small-subunit processome Utp21 domain-containing protein n=1 Tax=Nasonia vitripennis TaxID=7425 RepID=A0A7M7GEW3_NASVI|nr:WD repeat-containing protein 36 [Nasonia vitripennis]
MSHSKVFQRNRALGYVSNHIPVVTRYIQRRKENLIVTCTGRNFHTYGCSHFTLLSVSGAHPEDITCLSADTYHVYTASGNKIYAWRRGNELKHTYKGHESQVHLLLPFGPHLVSIDEGSNLMIWDIKTEEVVSESNFSNNVFKITALMHPNTYINKILLGSEQGQMQLWNIKLMKMIYTFSGWNFSISIIEQAPAVDVVAVGLIDGRIILHNLKVDQTVFELVQDWGVVTSISFRSDGHPIMATGSLQGHIVLWNLEQRKVESQILNAHFGSVTGLKCLPNEPLLVSSSPDNTLKLWIFDLADGAGRLLRLREGHAEPPTVIRFYGNDGHNILSISGDSSLRIFSTQTETFNKSLGRASYNRKASKKKGRAVDDPLIMPQMTNIAAESTRDKDWDNIATTHLGLGVVTTWSYDKLKMGEHKLLPEKFKFNMNVTATTVTITQCGNYVLAGYNTGHVERFNIQSGVHRSSYGSDKGAHEGPVKGISVDCLNTVVVTAGRDGKVKFWPFQALKPNDKEPKTVIDVKESVEWLRAHRENSLLATALQDFTIVLIDVDMQRIVRRFEGHTGRLNDATFSPDSRWLVTASMDRTIRVWDIPSSQLIDIFQVPEASTSVSFSPTGEFLASAHVCNLGIFLWSNRTLYSHVPLKAVKAEDKIPSISLPGSTADAIPDSSDSTEEAMVLDDDEDEDSKEYTSPDQLSPKLVTMSALATSRWLNLLNIDIVKKRNKPKDAPKTPAAAPFFLPTVSAPQLQFDFSDVQKQQDSAKLLAHPDFQSLTPFGQLLEKTAETNDFVQAVEKLKSMGPSAIDLEVQSLAFDMRCAVPMLLQFLKMIKHMLKSKKDFELAQAYLSLFLKCHGTMLSEEQELAEFLSDFQKLQLKSWKVVREKLFYNLSVVQHLKKT